MQLFVWNDTMREKIPVKVVPATDVDFGLTQKWQSQWTTLAAQGMPNKVALHRCDDNELLGLMSYQINEKGMAVEVVYVESAGHSNANLLKQTGGQKKYIGIAKALFAYAAKISVDAGFGGVLFSGQKPRSFEHIL